MSQSIGTFLGSFADVAPRSKHGAGGHAPSPAGSFADQLDASFRARATQLGLELPASARVDDPAAETAETVDDIWARVQRADASTNGMGDAVMRSLADAADARHEKRLDRRDDRFGR